jgi:ABC-type Fe3+-hydroxamate transport system substrate-binding protein
VRVEPPEPGGEVKSDRHPEGLGRLRLARRISRFVPSFRLTSALVFLVGGLSAASAAEKPRRVASLNLAADEVLVEILPAERLVGVTAFADEQGTSNVVGRVPKSVARFPKADLERLLSLTPDLVVVSEYTDADFLRLLEKSGLRVHRMRGLRSLAGFRAAILDLGRVVGEPEAAQVVVARYDARLRDLERRLEGATRPRVLYWANAITAGGDTAIGALIEGAGGRNVGTELGLTGVVPLGAERAFVADPDYFLVAEGWKSAEVLRAHPLLSQSRAVKQGHIVQIPTEKLVALSHHAAEACWLLAAGLHPGRVAKASP